MPTTTPTAIQTQKQASVYVRKKDAAGDWYYERVETGKGHKTGHLTPPFYSRPFTINSRGNKSQVWNQLKAQTFEEAQAEANLGVTAFGKPSIVESTNGRVLIKDAVAKYLDQKRGKSDRTKINYTFILEQFVEWLPSHIRFVDQIDNGDTNVLDSYMRYLEEKGYEPRTIKNKVSVICFMLKKRRNFAAGIETPSKIIEMPQVEEEPAVPYSADELKKIFSAATEEEYVRFLFFLHSAGREQEVSTAEWKDIQADGKFHIHAKTWVSNFNHKEKKFTPKKHVSRFVPLTDEVISLLKDLRKTNDSRWIFPNESGDPDGHLLRKFKKLVYRADLNCGHCHNDQWGPKETCSTKPEGCEKHYLHRLRKTRATFWHHQGEPIRNIQAWLGHKSLETTQKYLGIVDTPETQERVNRPMF